MKSHHVALIVTATLLCACNRHSTPLPTAPSPGSTTPPPAPTNALLRVAVSGNTALAAVGETTQLTAIAQYSDGTTKELTEVSGWQSSDPTTIAVTSTGLATAHRLGSTYVFFNFQGKQAGVTVRATPPGTFIISGRVREPGNGGLPNVTVQTDRGETLTTGPDGLYTTGGLSGTVRLAVSVSGFETTSVTAIPDDFQDIPLQRIVHLSEGNAVSFTLAPHDVEYVVSPLIRCGPCRLVRLSIGFTGTLELAATWTDSRARLNVWVKDRDLITEGPGSQSMTGTLAVTPGDLQLYVGMATPANAYVTTKVTARIR